MKVVEFKPKPDDKFGISIGKKIQTILENYEVDEWHLYFSVKETTTSIGRLSFFEHFRLLEDILNAMKDAVEGEQDSNATMAYWYTDAIQSLLDELEAKLKANTRRA